MIEFDTVSEGEFTASVVDIYCDCLAPDNVDDFISEDGRATGFMLRLAKLWFAVQPPVIWHDEAARLMGHHFLSYFSDQLAEAGYYGKEGR